MCLPDFSYSFGGELVGLNAIGQMNHAKRNIGPELGGHASGSAPPGGVAIEHQNHAPEMIEQSALLRWVQCRAHQRHGGYAGLMQLQTVEETFHEDGSFAARQRAHGGG